MADKPLRDPFVPLPLVPRKPIETVSSDISPQIIPEVPVQPIQTVDSAKTPSINDFSDIRITRPEQAYQPPMQLPIRGEKRLIPHAVNVASLGQNLGNVDNQIDAEDFYVTAARKTFTDFIVVKIPHRGLDPSNGNNPNPALDATFRFLINPATVQISHTTLDTQSFTRGGWQFGVWGEDLIRISMQGTTAGQYFSTGLTDEFQYYAQSYRNLQQLLMVYENNGYWFEGEEVGEGPLAAATAADFQRRRIKCHQDIQLIVGNFIWYGMFDGLTISQDAQNPFTLTFNLSFVAWKERFREGSPYWDSIHNDVQRGHVYGWQSNIGWNEINRQLANLPLPKVPLLPPPTVLPPDTPQVNQDSPAILSAQLEDSIPLVDSSVSDINYNDPMFNPTRFF